MHNVLKSLATVSIASLVLVGCGTVTQSSLEATAPNGPWTKAVALPGIPEPTAIPRVSATLADYDGRPILFDERETLPETGAEVHGMEEFEHHLTSAMRYFQVPGFSACISKDGKVIYRRTFGWCDLAKKAPVTESTRFRIGSVTKSFTSVCTMKLVEAGKLSLDDKAFELFSLPGGGLDRRDPGLRQITVRQLLQCTAGWDRDKSGDPFFTPHVQAAATEYSTTMRPDSISVIDYWTSHFPLDFDPGTAYSYSNLAYAVLGQVIEAKSGMTYPEFVRQTVIEPASLTRTDFGHTLQRLPDETLYYPFPGQELGAPVFPNFVQRLPLPYGGDFSLDAMKAAIGLVSTPSELVRFADAVFASDSKLVSSKSIEAMTERPSVEYWQGKKEFFASGWEVIQNDDPLKRVVYRQGSIAGTLAVVAHRGDGYTWSFTCNSRPLKDAQFQWGVMDLFWKAIDQHLKKA